MSRVRFFVKTLKKFTFSSDLRMVNADSFTPHWGSGIDVGGNVISVATCTSLSCARRQSLHQLARIGNGELTFIENVDCDISFIENNQADRGKHLQSAQ